ncbi:hypothetical protein HDU76_001602 [Blyttiomyces sp. JEL0837]|nr:hypothetical protein HDU76_001602 [Blyttiomyces sp. JEL0837]
MVVYKVIIYNTLGYVTSYCNTPYSKETTCPNCINNPNRLIAKYVFYNETDGRLKELSGLILLSMMRLPNPTSSNQEQLFLQDITSKLISRPESFITLNDHINSSNSVAIRCLTSPHIGLQMMGNTITVAFVSSSKETKIIYNVNPLDFALWDCGVLENQKLTEEYDMFFNQHGKVRMEAGTSAEGGESGDSGSNVVSEVDGSEYI